uniref:Similar to Callose synthase 3 n=1 Tax=Arundo donax TaxID=35708 RepID=A0A0A8Z638_ARUDO
MSIFGQLSVFC